MISEEQQRWQRHKCLSFTLQSLTLHKNLLLFQSGWEQLTLAHWKSAQPFREQTFTQGPQKAVLSVCKSKHLHSQPQRGAGRAAVYSSNKSEDTILPTASQKSSARGCRWVKPLASEGNSLSQLTTRSCKPGSSSRNPGPPGPKEIQVPRWQLQ